MGKIFIYLFTLPAFLFSSAVDEYFKKTPELKKLESWRKITTLGQKALADESATDKERALIHAELASNHYYLGEYEEVEVHALGCLALAKALPKPDLLVRSLYLLSADQRALGQQADDPLVAGKHFIESMQWIEKALDFIPLVKSRFIRAKVFFNAGAIYTDSRSGDLEKAVPYYEKALALFKELNHQDDYNRSAIRLGKTYLKLGVLSKVEAILVEIEPLIGMERTLANFYLLNAEFFIKKENRQKAKSTIEKALTITKKLEMTTETKTLETLLENL